VAGNHRREKGSWGRPGRAAKVLVKAPGRRLRAEQLEDRTVPAIIQDGIPNWLTAGPFPSTNGQTSGLPDNPVTGAVQAITPHPTNPNILFAAGVNGGVWRTTDALDANPVWTPLTDQMPSLSVASMSLNPQNPNQLLVGLGALSSAGGVSGDLIGLLYTNNALAPTPAFQVFTGPADPTTGRFLLANQTFRAVIARNGYLLAAGSGGLFRSTNQGVTWRQIDGTGNLPAGSLLDAVADPGLPNRVYVAGRNGMFRTDDITAPNPVWINVTDPQQQIGATTESIKIAIHNSPGNNIVYVAAANPAPDPAESQVTVTWSANGGAVWNVMDEATTLAAALTITDATNASPISITIGGVIDTGINTGDQVLIQNVTGNLGANGIWTVTRTSATAFTLNGSSGTGVYTGGGVAREIFGVSPGGQAAIHMGLAADPTNPNVVYLSGDRQENPFPTSIGGNDFTANILRGDRTLPRGFGAFAPSPQWIAITNNLTTNKTAPHADSRRLVFDAQGNLLEGDDGGIYKRTDPQTSSGDWVSVNGNIGLGQFYQVRLDTVNNVIFGGTQDTGSVEQLDGTTGPAGNTTWNSGLLGDGFWQGVDNTGKQVFGDSFRYMMGNTVETFRRREFDPTNKLVGVTQVLLASPTNPTKAFDGLDASDKGSFGPNVFTLNSIDGRMMMLGINKLYEDNDPNPALGMAGDVIANITPQNFKGRVTSIVYGGHQNGIPITRVSWVSTDAGQLWVRGAAGGFTEVDANLPAGTGAIDQVVTDPDDWRSAYVLRANHIYKTTDAGATWVELTENLAATGFDSSGNPVGGLSTQINAIAVWDPNPGTTTGGVILLAGGRSGVFRYVPGVADPAVLGGNWLAYGAGLTNAVVSDIEVYGNTVIVGSQGRGAWRIQDVSTTIGAKAIVRVIGTPGNDNMAMVADGSNPAFVIVTDGQGNSLRVSRTVAQGFDFQGLAGADTVTFAANGLPGGDLNFIRFPVTVEMGGDVGDMLVFQNAGKSTPTVVTVTANTVGGGPFDNIFSSLGGTKVTYTGLQNGTLRIDLGPEFVNGNGVAIQSTSAGTTQIIGTNGSDEIDVNSNAGTGGGLTGTLAGINGAIAVDGRSGANDQLVLSDFGAAAGNTNVLVGSGVVTGLAGPTDSAVVFYANLNSLVVMGSNSPVLPEKFTLQNPTAPVTVLADDGPDTINLRGNTLPVTINGGLGNDSIHISSLAGISDDGDVSGVLGPVTVDGGPGDNQLIVSNFNSAVGSNVTVTSDQIIGLTPVPITYQAGDGRFFNSTGDGLLIRGSANAGDNFTIASTLAGSQTAVDGVGGNNNFTVDGENLAGNVWLRGGTGNNNFGLFVGVFGVTSDSLRFTGGPGHNTVGFSGFDGDENVVETLTAPAGGPVNTHVTGLGGAFDVDTVQSLVYDGLGGRNNLSIIDATNKSYGSVSDPASGIVFQSTSANSGQVSIDRGTVGPVMSFNNATGSDAKGVLINGDPTGTGAFRDVLTVLGVSDVGLQSPLGEPTAADGTDNIFVADTGVTMQNTSLGFLRSVAIDRDASGLPTMSALVVEAGNEADGRGDHVTVLPSKLLNIFVDGGTGGTVRRGGNKLDIATTVPHHVERTTDPAFGPPQTRVVFDDGSSFGFVNFQNAGGVGRRLFAVGADAGGGPRVQVFDADTHALVADFFAYEPSFTGGVRVAVGDVNGDGVPDIITAAGAGGGPNVKVFDGTDFTNIAGFFAYEPTFTAGVYVAVGDVNGDGVDEIITGTGFGGGPLVRVFNAAGIDQGAFFAYDDAFRGGVRVGAGDVTGGGVDEIVTAPGPGGGPDIRVVSFPAFTDVERFFALSPDYRQGVFVTAGDMDGDGKAEIAIGPSETAAPQVTIVRSNGQTLNLSIFDIGAFDTAQPLPAVSPDVLSATGLQPIQDNGIRVAMTAPDASGKAQLLVGRGPGTTPRVHAFSLDPAQEVYNVVALDGAFDGGIFVG
jgi:hypothetical protein